MPEDKKKEEIKDLILNKDIENDVNKIHEKKEKIEYVDKFNYWIYIGLITLLVLLILSFILLIYTIFFNRTILTEPIDKKIFTSSVASESIEIPKELNNIKKSKSIFSSLFSSKPVVDNNNSPVSSIDSSIDNPVSSNNNSNNSSVSNKTTIDSNSSSNNSSSNNSNNSSLFSSLLSSFKTKKTNDNIPTLKPSIIENVKTTDVDTLNKNILKGVEENKQSDSIFTSFLSPLYKRKVELPKMKYTGGNYNKILKRI